MMMVVVTLVTHRDKEKEQISRFVKEAIEEGE
jgi:hypothetical protein